MKKIIISVIATTALLTACGSSPSATPSANPSAAGRQFTSEQLQAALPATAQLDETWSAHPAAPAPSPSASDGNKVSPKVCRTVFKALGNTDFTLFTSAKPAGDAAQVYSPQDQKIPATISLHVSSFAAPVAGSGFADFAATLSKCPQIEVKDPTGGVSSWKVSLLPLPNYADKTIAINMEGSVAGTMMVAQVVFISAGNNLVSVTNIGINGLVQDLTNKTAQATIDNLAAIK